MRQLVFCPSVPKSQTRKIVFNSVVKPYFILPHHQLKLEDYLCMRTGGEGIGRCMKTPTGCLYHIDQFQLSTDLNAFLDYFDRPFDVRTYEPI